MTSSSLFKIRAPPRDSNTALRSPPPIGPLSVVPSLLKSPPLFFPCSSQPFHKHLLSVSSKSQMQAEVFRISVPTPTMATTTAASGEEDLVILPSSSTSLDDEAVTKALLPRIPSFSSNHQRRRRAASEGSLPSLPARQQSFRRDVGHAASETYLLTRLSFKLLRYLGVGYRWISKFLALGCYAMLLMPGFLQVGYYYFFSSQVRRSVVYGDQPRNRLDLYLPTDINEPKPVVAFVTGGAWIIGYKAWGALLGQQLAERDIIVACIDYRNFPQGTISDMVDDASRGISFVCNNIAEYGGDPNRIYLVGQSAGAHIAACALLDQAIKECGEGDEPTWSVSQIRAYFGISGGYNISKLVDHFHGRGLYRSIFLSIMEGEQSLDRFSPERIVRNPSVRHAVSLLPRIILFHGTADYSIPSAASKDFADALREAGVEVDLILYEGKTHTDLFLQDPLRGGNDELLQDITAVIHAGDEAALSKDMRAPPRRRLVPEVMLKMAHNSRNAGSFLASHYVKKAVGALMGTSAK